MRVDEAGPLHRLVGQRDAFERRRGQRRDRHQRRLELRMVFPVRHIGDFGVLQPPGQAGVAISAEAGGNHQRAARAFMFLVARSAAAFRQVQPLVDARFETAGRQPAGCHAIGAGVIRRGIGLVARYTGAVGDRNERLRMAGAALVRQAGMRGRQRTRGPHHVGAVAGFLYIIAAEGGDQLAGPAYTGGAGRSGNHVGRQIIGAHHEQGQRQPDDQHQPGKHPSQPTL